MKTIFHKKVFSIFFKFFSLSSLFTRIDTVFRIIFCKIDLSIKSFLKKSSFKFSTMLLCTHNDAIFTTILCKNDISIPKVVFIAPKFLFFAIVPVYSHWYGLQNKFHMETILHSQIFLENLFLCFWSLFLCTAIDTISAKKL